MLREVESDDLTVGMYVSELDRPWLDTPFPVQGFYIRSTDDVARVAACCERVFVDPRRYDRRLAEAAAAFDPRHARRVTDPGKQVLPEALPAPKIRYEDFTSVEDELPVARDAMDASSRFLERFWARISAGQSTQLSEVRSAIDPLVESILRNKDALVALTRVRLADRHTHEHCLAMAVWAGLMGRQLGLPADEVKKLALGCSLIDTGMVRLPPELLRSDEPLSKAERLILRSHVVHSLEMLARMGGTDDDVHGIVRWHHERRDGSGYPDGLEGGDIPMYARIAGILDSYDAMISPRRRASARSSFEALAEIQDLCPVRFQPELVEQYAQAVGLFPSGCLVELSTGEVGVVFSQNTGRRLRPKVMLILDAGKRPRRSLPIVDLKAESEHAVRISRELRPGEYGLNALEYFV